MLPPARSAIGALAGLVGVVGLLRALHQEVHDHQLVLAGVELLEATEAGQVTIRRYYVFEGQPPP